MHFLFYLASGGGLMKLAEVRGGAQQDRFVGGAQQVAQRLAARLRERGLSMHLGTPVLAIEQDERGVTVRTEGAAWRAAHVIVAIPPVLAGRLDYRPALPPLRDQLTQRMPMGSVIKCFAAYPTPHWRKAGLSGEVLTDEGPLRLIFDASSPDGSQGALVGFALAQSARAWMARPADERRQAVLATFARHFGPEAATPIDYVEQDWSAEVYTRGCYVGLMPPGTLTAYGTALRAPVGRIHWAGTETATVWNGYMEGALGSGERAAAEVLERSSPLS